MTPFPSFWQPEGSPVDSAQYMRSPWCDEAVGVGVRDSSALPPEAERLGVGRCWAYSQTTVSVRNEVRLRWWAWRVPRTGDRLRSPCGGTRKAMWDWWWEAGTALSRGDTRRNGDLLRLRCTEWRSNHTLMHV